MSCPEAQYLVSFPKPIVTSWEISLNALKFNFYTNQLCQLSAKLVGCKAPVMQKFTSEANKHVFLN